VFSEALLSPMFSVRRLSTFPPSNDMIASIIWREGVKKRCLFRQLLKIRSFYCGFKGK
jgi:hypothetical protein